MRRPHRRVVPLVPAHHELEWPQELAAAVIRQALLDARNGLLPRKDRDDAAAFLRPGDDRLAIWCVVAGIHVDVIHRRVSGPWEVR